VAAPAVIRMAATENIAETHRDPAPIGFVIEFLASKCAAAVPRRSVRWMEPTSSARRCAGTEKEIGPDGSDDRLEHSRGECCVSWRECCSEVDRCGAVMTEHKAGLAIALRRSRGIIPGCRSGHQNGRRARRIEGKPVMVLSKQRRPEEDRKNAEKCSRVAPRQQPRRLCCNLCDEPRTHAGPIPRVV
jgi:hypothetical protein